MGGIITPNKLGSIQYVLFQASAWQLLALVKQGFEFSDLRSSCVLDREDSSWLWCVD